MSTAAEIQARWRGHLFSTTPADRDTAETAVKAFYGAIGLDPPRYFCWFDSPCAAAWAVGLLVESRHSVWSNLLGAARKRRDDRERIQRTESHLQACAGQPDFERTVAAMGGPLATGLMFVMPPPKIVQRDIMTARIKLYPDVTAMFGQSASDELTRAEGGLWGTAGVLNGHLHCPTAESLVGISFFSEYTFAQMAADESHAGDRPPPPLLRAAWTIAQSAGPWWPWVNGAILTERPTEIHVNEKGLLHRGDGPAAVYRDGWRVFAWEGYAMPEQWILHPETIPARDLKNGPASFRKQVAALGAGRPKAASRPKRSGVLDRALPADAASRVALLREHAGGRLPLFDRYVAGEHASVWTELVSLGDDVRRDPNAADALAVAYETMQRVEANIRTLIDRLSRLGYRFTTPPPHRPPGRRTWRQIQQVERLVGALPLSLRAFYDVVGAIDLIGRHQGIAPSGSSVAPDPLVVFGVEDAFAECESMDDDERSVITIAPDDLHKANTSGGDPYAVAVPDQRADGVLLDERHNLLFVDYLRLCFRYGGFSGYEGTDQDVPAELDQLRAGLEEF